jgi:hypothetical protein
VSVAAIALTCFGCGSAATSKPSPAHITRFDFPEKKVPKGVKAQLCYGVENASKVEVTPAAGDMYPAPARCVPVEPAGKTSYTLTAYGADGSKDTKTAEIDVGPAPPRIYDVTSTATSVRKGEVVVVCFMVENATSVKAEPGRFDAKKNCITDRPVKTTDYRISALGGDRQIDNASVTVHVR